MIGKVSMDPSSGKFQNQTVCLLFSGKYFYHTHLIVYTFCHVTIPFQTNRIIHKATYNKVRIVHCIYGGVKDYNFKKNVFVSLEINFV